MHRRSNKELDRLNNALRELEEPEEELFPEIESDPDSLFSESWYQEFLPEENPAVDFGRTVYADESTDSFSAGSSGRKRQQARRLEQKQQRSAAAAEKKKRKKKKKGISGLILLALAEVAAILCILRWWIIWLT